MLPTADLTALAHKPPVILLEGRLPILEAPEVKALGLHDGQVVRPTVEVRDGQVMLMLQGRALPAPPEWRLAPGDRPALRLQIDPRGQARLWPATPGEGETEVVQATTASRAQQLALRPPGLEALAQLLRPGTLQTLLAGNPQPEVAPLVDQLLRLRPSMAQLTAQSLKHWIRHSGWFLESHLARGQATAGDAKGLLRQILAQWSDASEPVTRLLGEAIDDIEAAQVQSSDGLSPLAREPGMTLLLPFVDADPVVLKFRQGSRGQGGGQESAPLVIDLHTRSRDLGEVWLQTRISQQTQVQMVMWAVQDSVVESARASTQDLSDALEDAGLSLVSLQVVHGPRTGTTEDPASDGPAGRLVDIQA